MINFYVYRIKTGKMTIEQVPEKWREKVRNIIDKNK